MGDRIEPAPDTGDERLVELIRWTRESGMPDVHALLLDLQRHRAAQAASAERVRAVVQEATIASIIDSALFYAWSQLTEASHRKLTDAIGCRVAHELTARPVLALTPDDRAILIRLRAMEIATKASIGHLGEDVRRQCDGAVVLLNRLLGGAP